MIQQASYLNVETCTHANICVRLDSSSELASYLKSRERNELVSSIEEEEETYIKVNKYMSMSHIHIDLYIERK